jgi:peptidoglycan/LPS O-acetylase OafA/YrhL
MPAVPFPVLAAGLLLALLAGPWFGPLYDVFAVLIIFPAIVALGTKDRASPRWRSVALSAGALSYPVYILHEATFAHFTHFQGRSATVTFLVFAAAFIAIALVSYVALRWYDEPVRHWLARHAQRARLE